MVNSNTFDQRILMKNECDQQQKHGKWIAIGVAVGSSFGVGLDNIPAGLAIGLGLGFAVMGIANWRSSPCQGENHQ